MRQLGTCRRQGRGRRAVAPVLVVRVRVGVCRLMRMQAVGQKMGNSMHVWIWPLSSRIPIRYDVDVGAHYSSDTLDVISWDDRALL